MVGDHLMDVLLSITIFTVLFAFPASWFGAYYCWRLYREDLHDYPGDRLRFSLILAITSTMAAVGATLLAITALIVVLDLRNELRLIATPSLYIAVMILDIIPILNAIYLRIRRGSPSGVQSMATIPGSDGEPLESDT